MSGLFNICKICIVDNCWDDEICNKTPGKFYCKYFELDKSYENYDGYSQSCFCCLRIKACKYLDEHWDAILFVLHETFNEDFYQEKVKYMIEITNRKY